MPRSVLRLVLVLAAILAPIGNAGLAAPPPRSNSTVPLDLAAMLLFQPDLHNPDAWIKNGSTYGVDTWSGYSREQLESAGYVRGIQGALSATPHPTEDFLIYSFVDEFKDNVGAASGVNVFLNVNGSSPETGTRTIGDQSWLLRLVGPDPNSGRTMHELIEVFRIGRLSGSVYLLDFTGRDPDIAQVEALSDIVAARMKAALTGQLHGPNLGDRIVRYNVDWSLTFRDGYMRLDGKERFGKDDVAAGPPSFNDFYSGATDVYFFGQSLNTKPDAPSASWRVADFDTEDAASAWAASYIANNQTGEGAWTVDSQSDARKYGDETHIAAYHLPAGADAPSKTIEGAIVVARFGKLGVAVRVQAFEPVSTTIVEALMAAESTCLNSGATSCGTAAAPAS